MENIDEKLFEMRLNYTKKSLSEKDIMQDPIEQFVLWFSEALHSDVIEANAMQLATANNDSVPSVRTVLLKSYDKEGFVFFTNYLSNKASDLEENPQASLLFWWRELERQVRIGGSVKRISKEESDHYFSKRPFESQLGAWSSPQSKVVTKEELELNFEKEKERFREEKIYRPAYWGGYSLKPKSIEFWQGRPNRMHDRILYTLINNVWKTERLAP